MKDGIIKGTGNSRYLKSNIPEGTTVEQLVAMLRAGTLPIDLNGINAAGWQQIGDALNKANLLDDITQTVFGLSDADATVNMALRKLILPEGKYAVVVTALTPMGRPIANVTVSGIKTSAGADCVTDADGRTFGISSTQTVTLAASGVQYIDCCASSVSVTLQPNIVNTVTVQYVSWANNSREFADSYTMQFSEDVDSFDCSAIGGGGNGGGYYKSGSTVRAGCGGGSGYIANSANNKYTFGDLIQFIVGAQGGTSTVQKLPYGVPVYCNAPGGTSGTDTSPGAGGAPGGLGAQSPGGSLTRDATNGGNQSNSFLYPPRPEFGGAGGGGQVEYASSTYSNYGRGGSSNGGDGGTYLTLNGESGQRNGAGGGGAFVSSVAARWGSGGVGVRGAVGFMWHYK